MRSRRPAARSDGHPAGHPAGRIVRTRDKVLPPLISVSTVAVVGLVVYRAVVTAEQWPRIKAQFFSIDAIVEVFPNVLKGFGVNMSVWAVALLVIAVWALFIAVFRSLNGPWFTPLRVFAVVYIDLLRGLPSLLLVLLFGFGVPALRIPGLPKLWRANGFSAPPGAHPPPW